MADVLPIFFVVAAGLCLSLVLLALWQSLRVLLVREPSALAPGGPRNAARVALLREKQELLTAIRDVRSEHELGKVSDADFSQLEQRYRGRAREVLRALDEQIAPHRERARKLLQDALAAAPAAGASEAASQPAAAPATGASIPAVAPSPASEPAASRTACPQCATRNEPDAVFCKKCGLRLQGEAAS